MAPELGTSPSLHTLRTAAAAGSYERRRPEETTLHAIVREQLESFLAGAREGGRPVPRVGEQELRAYPACGVLAHGLPGQGWRRYWWHVFEHEPNLESLRAEPGFRAMHEELRTDMAEQLARVREMERNGELEPIPEILRDDSLTSARQ